MTNETRTCRECGRRLTGRSDKKFCADMCRNTHNNRLASFRNNTIRHINYTLHKNRRILDVLCPEEKAQVSRISLGNFDFRYFTHVRKTRKGNTYFYVYDMGYLELGNDSVLIVRG